MIVFRLARQKYKALLSGEGASLYGARWNSVGTKIIYTASNRALAMAELLVHLNLFEVPNDFFMLNIRIPDKAPQLKISATDLPPYWNSPIDYTHATQSIGDSFIRTNSSLVLLVPSAVVKGDYNVLINPFHKLFKKVKIEETVRFPFDERLFE